MIEIDTRDTLALAGLEDAPEHVQRTFMNAFYDELEHRVGTRIAAELSPEGLESFDSFVERGSSEEMGDLLARLVPGYQDIVAHEVRRAIDELRDARASSSDEPVSLRLPWFTSAPMNRPPGMQIMVDRERYLAVLWNLGRHASPPALMTATRLIHELARTSMNYSAIVHHAPGNDRLLLSRQGRLYIRRERFYDSASMSLRVVGQGYTNPWWEVIQVVGGLAAAGAAVPALMKRLIDLSLRVSNLGLERRAARARLIREAAEDELAALRAAARSLEESDALAAVINAARGHRLSVRATDRSDLSFAAEEVAAGDLFSAAAEIAEHMAESGDNSLRSEIPEPGQNGVLEQIEEIGLSQRASLARLTDDQKPLPRPVLNSVLSIPPTTTFTLDASRSALPPNPSS